MKTRIRTKKRRQRTYNAAVDPLRIDPSRTVTLRNQFAAEVKRRFDRLRVQVIKLLEDEDAFGLKKRSRGLPILNFDASQPRANDGKWTSGGGSGGSSVIDRLKSVGAKVAHIEHAAKAYATDKIGATVAKLPGPAQRVVETAFYAGKVSGKAAFATWTLGQSLAERVARERGATEEQARRLRGVLSSVDIAAMKPIQLGLGASGLGALALPASFIPPATTGYLAYSTARNPMATARAAIGIVKETLGKVRSKLGLNELAVNGAYEGAELIARSLEEHDYDDWYIALLSAAIDEMRDVRQALEIDHEAIQQQGWDISIPQEDDAEAVLGSGLVENRLTTNDRWAFRTDPEKVVEFQEWLRSTIGKDVLGSEDDELWTKYVEEGFKKGAGRAFDDVSLRRFGRGEGEFYRGSRQQFLRDSFARPETVEKLKLLAGRVYDDMEGVTSEMATRMVRHLTDGLTQGMNPREIARLMSKDIEGIGKVRAETIARSEVIRAHAEGQLSALESLGVEEVGVAVEWSTAQDGGVCKLCQPLEGIVLTIAEARGMIPRHPRCRCVFAPANVGEEDEGQKRTRSRILQSVRLSQKRGTTKDDWGPGTTIAKKRPEDPTANYEGIPTSLLDSFFTWWTLNERVSGTFFARCARDDKGRCKGEGEGSNIFSTPDELAKAQAIARRKAKNAPLPTEEEKSKAVSGIAEIGANLYRKNLVGNSTDRARRRQQLLNEFGDGKSCPCVYCGLKIKDGTLEQDKIYTTAEGGKYRTSNLVPACGSCNKHRGDIPWKNIKWK